MTIELTEEEVREIYKALGISRCSFAAHLKRHRTRRRCDIY